MIESLLETMLGPGFVTEFWKYDTEKRSSFEPWKLEKSKKDFLAKRYIENYINFGDII